MTSRNHLIAHIHHPTERWSIGRMEEKKKIHQRASSSFSRKRRIKYTRENLKTHRNDFVDRFLRRIRLGDDLDASKLGSECKHDDDVRERYILFVRDEGHVAPTKNQKETRSLRLKRDEEISFSLFTTKRKEFLATTEEKKGTKRKRRHKKKKQKIQNTASSNC